jgi:hypothetical protein
MGIKVRPSNFALSKNVTFPIANEDFSTISNDLKKVKSMKYYLGICGGGTQNLYLLQLLIKMNSFRWIRLIDTNREQLLNFIDIVNALEDSKDDLSYISKLAKRKQRIPDGRYIRYFSLMFERESFGFEETNLRKPKLKDMEIELVNNEFLKYVKTENLPRGKYFIYVSNIFSYTRMSLRLKLNRLLCIGNEILSGDFRNLSERAEFRHAESELEKLISKNKSVLNGSVILVNLGGFSLRSKNKEMALFSKAKNKIKLINKVKVPN